jgi:hypothetical protein
VENGASRSITNNRKDFIDTPRLVHTIIEGYSGTSEASLIRTVRWTIADDQGLEHNILLPNTILDEKAKKRILSPQHWSQTTNDHYPTKYGTWCATLDDSEGESDHEIPHRTQGPQETLTKEGDSKPITLDMLFQEQDEPGLPQQSFDAKEQEYQHWYTKLGHLSKTRMKQLANIGMIPKYLAKIELSLHLWQGLKKTPGEPKVNIPKHHAQ